MWYLKDSNGKKSFSATMFFIAFNVGLWKLLMSGVNLHGYKFETFSASDFSVLVVATGGVYSFRKYTDKDKKGTKDEENDK